MDIDTARRFFLWCSLLNYGMLLGWAMLVLFGRDGLHRLWGRWFRLTPDQFDMLNFGGMTVYKVGILLFNVVPWIVLYLVK